MGRSSHKERVGRRNDSGEIAHYMGITHTYHVGMKQCTFSVYTYVPEVHVNETDLNDSARWQSPLYVHTYLHIYIRTYRRLPKICPPPTLAHYFEAKLGRGHLLKNLISLVHTPPRFFTMLHLRLMIMTTAVTNSRRLC